MTPGRCSPPPSRAGPPARSPTPPWSRPGPRPPSPPSSPRPPPRRPPAAPPPRLRPPPAVPAPGPAAAFAALLDQPAPPLADGDPLPPGWHALTVLDRPATADPGEGRHPRARPLPP